jgi:hypothetical protein
MLRLVAAVVVVLMILAICGSLGENHAMFYDVSQPASDLVQGAERAAGDALRAAGREVRRPGNAVPDLPLTPLHPSEVSHPHHRGVRS